MGWAGDEGWGGGGGGGRLGRKKVVYIISTESRLAGVGDPVQGQTKATTST